MGLGDELLASGAARKLSKSGKAKILIVGGDGRVRWSDLWAGLPYITTKRTDGVVRMINGGGVRPYILRKTPERWMWQPYKPTPAQIVFTPAELAFAEPYRGMIMIEPAVKNIGHMNKAWFDVRWQEVAARAPIAIVQCMPPSIGIFLNGATFAHTPTFRHACAVLSVCKAFIGTEGGLGHAAAAVGTPAVILWSEFISPDITGYDLPTMINIRHAGKACGMRTNCPGCRKSMEAITVDEVIGALEKLL